MKVRRWQRLAIACFMRGVPRTRREELADELLSDAAARRTSGRARRFSAVLWFVHEARSIGRAYRNDARGELVLTVWRDAVLALRSYARTPVFTLVVLLTMTLGIGATSAIFSLVNGVLLRPLPYDSPAQLVRVYQTDRLTGKRGVISPPNYFDLKDHAPAFESISAFWSPSLNITSPGVDPEKVLAAVCSHDLFTTLGVPARIGRTFMPEDDAPGAAQVVVIAYGLWQRRFGGESDVIGRALLIDGNPATIVGVMPPAFDFPTAGTELWAPLRLSRTQPPNPAIPGAKYRQYRILNVIARLRSGVSVQQAGAELADAARPLEDTFPDSNHGLTLTATPLYDVIVGPARQGLLILLAAVSCVLLIACGNVGSLMLVRATTRRREVAIRLALGATRGRLVQQLLTECIAISAVGGALGLVVSAWALPVLIRFAPVGVPRLAQADIDGTVVAVTAAISVLAGLAFGVAPALRSGRGELQAHLRRAGGVGATNRRLRNGLVIAELGLSLALVFVAGLLIQSLRRVEGVEIGFRPASVLTFDRIELPRQRVRPEIAALFFDELLTKIRAIRSVQFVGATLGLPLDPRAGFYVDQTTFSLPGEAPVPVAQRPTAPIHVVTPGYFAAVGVPLIRGREFTTTDRADSQPVVVVNESMARRYWPNQDPVGQHLTHDLVIVAGQPNTREIVGVVGDVRHFGLERTADAQMYVPHAQMPWPSMAVVVRTDGDPASATAAVRQAVRSMDRTIVVPPMRPLTNVVAGASADSRFRAWLLGLFAATALLLAGIGLYGTMAYAVQQRAGEVALRVALGATGRQARGVVLREGLKLVGSGLVIGAVVAAASARAIGGVLYGVGAADPATFAASAIALGAMGWLACYLPVRRAGQTDPLRMLNRGG